MIGILIPVHNEEALLGECLKAAMVAASHPGLLGEAVQILAVLDTCSDDSAEIAQAYPVQVLHVQARNVGHVRGVGARHLLNQGARWISCTDADSRVAPDWLVAQLALGVDAVCGTVTVDAWSEGFDPAAQIRYHQAYQACDGHRHIHGANLGVSAGAYVQAGGFEPLACHEDVQLVRNLERCGASIAWSHDPQVITSARLDCRAEGGFGDYLKSLMQAT
ncbi:glycosyltransferase family 2 protein [Pseudomonas tolaasii]|uniref:Glycosyltransferase family 2 protein n=2 Tax=Pseudomonas tolaasii TaxID=29442 RepID=A0A7Y8AHZ0_PSETO|nr:glycosyltransferase [Pseudomonas tolaasii]ARB30577.1 glycosyl transferase [Pseudomonas tolaasii]KAB0468852.1 glycosyltransferase [Pseudomonas tolaasii]MBY8941889.1 glycosyltransferase family 2 protein [Pseudomonas tolaasii]NWC23833.1 glycosyltransferase family 2 protein [Pseudomonas tolaasii]NWC41756.1 glycosyltransferase family 2 protein [Pseudomonas tolaasii]